MNEINNTIFDLGGEIINLDYNGARNAFIELVFTNFYAVYSQAQHSGFLIRCDSIRKIPATDAEWKALLTEDQSISFGKKAQKERSRKILE